MLGLGSHDYLKLNLPPQLEVLLIYFGILNLFKKYKNIPHSDINFHFSINCKMILPLEIDNNFKLKQFRQTIGLHHINILELLCNLSSTTVRLYQTDKIYSFYSQFIIRYQCGFIILSIFIAIEFLWFPLFLDIKLDKKK